jgi:hypothetical protein
VHFTFNVINWVATLTQADPAGVPARVDDGFSANLSGIWARRGAPVA